MSGQIKPVYFSEGELVRGKIGGRKITMSNALTRASHGLTLAEKRIVMMAVSQLNPNGKAPAKLTTRISAQDYAKQFNLERHTAYKQLRDASNNLYNRSITFYKEAHSREGKPLTEPARIRMRWVSAQVLYPEDGVGEIELDWNDRILPHLIGLRKQFTSYQLKQASALRSTYSWKLLELLMRFEKTGWAEYTVEDFCESMGASEKVRANFGKVREKIITPAVKELTEKDNWIIELTTTKRGRRIHRLRFDFKRNEQLDLDI